MHTCTKSTIKINDVTVAFTCRTSLRLREIKCKGKNKRNKMNERTNKKNVRKKNDTCDETPKNENDVK